MKRLLNILFVILLVQSFLPAQSCYIQLDDASGFDTSPYLSELEGAACALRDALPIEFQKNFAVYDFGFYTQDELSLDGFQTDLDKLVDEISTDYYIVFGKQSDQSGIYTKFWIDVNLPSTGEFECLDLLSPTMRDDLVTKYNIRTNQIYNERGTRPYEYAEVEKQIINDLMEFVIDATECCEPQEGFRSNGLCTACIFTSDEILAVQESNRFLLDPVEVISDPDFIDPPSAIRSNIESITKSSTTPFNIELRFPDGTEIGFDDYISLFQSEQIASIYRRTGISTSISLHTFKYPRDCGLFEIKWQEYQDDESNHKVFISVTNMDNHIGIIGYHSTNR